MRSDVAESLARELLSESLPRRWEHVRGVAARARRLATSASKRLDALLIPSALLHDIGYARDLAGVGFHPIDGARHLRRLGADERIVNLVAHHSCAGIEAELRGLRSILDDEFPKDDSLPHEQLCFCDMTTGPDGELVTVDERLAEVRNRYGEGTIVHDFVDLAEPEIRAIANRVTAGIDQPK